MKAEDIEIETLDGLALSDKNGRPATVGSVVSGEVYVRGSVGDGEPLSPDRSVAIALCAALEHLRECELAGITGGDDPCILDALEAARRSGIQAAASERS